MNSKISQNSGESQKKSLETFLKRGEVSEILEWTFMYDSMSKKEGLPYNTTFFESIGRITYSQWKAKEISADILIQKVIAKLSGWQKILANFRDIQLITQNEKTQIEREGVNYMIDTIEMAKIAVPIELEKSSVESILKDDERIQEIQKMDMMQTKIYGEKLSDNITEIFLTLKLMRKEWKNGKQYLSEQQQRDYISIYQNIIGKLNKKFPGTVFEVLEFVDEEDIYIMPDEVKKANNIQLTKDTYMELWQLYIEANGLKQKVITSPNASSIFDGPKTLEIPTSSGYDTMNLFNVISIMVHEVSGHYINQKISEDNGFIVRGAKNLEKEEGLAVLLEGLVQGKRLNGLKNAGYSFPYIIAGELLSSDERQNLVNLRIKIDTEGKHEDTNHSRDLRVMRGYSLQMNGAQRKDMSYGRGLLKIIGHIESGKFSLTDFFAGKFSIEDITSGRINSLIPKEKKFFPLFFPEMLLYIFTYGRKEFTHEKFIHYLRKKYSSILSNEDIDSIQRVSQFTKLKVFVHMWKDIQSL